MYLLNNLISHILQNILLYAVYNTLRHFKNIIIFGTTFCDIKSTFIDITQ